MVGQCSELQRKSIEPMAKRLFIIEVWFRAAYAERRDNGHIPEELAFQSKPQLAAGRLQAISEAGLVIRQSSIDGSLGA